MMSRNNSANNSCFSAIFDPSNPNENYSDKKNVYKESILVAALNLYANARIAKVTLDPGITV